MLLTPFTKSNATDSIHQKQSSQLLSHMLNLKMQLEFQQHVCEAKLCTTCWPDNVLQVDFMEKPLVVFGMCLIKAIAGTLAAHSEVSHSFQRSSMHETVQYIYCSPHINQFSSVLKSFLLINSFYSSEEYFAWNSNRDHGSV
jgi:hypothetical protein